MSTMGMPREAQKLEQHYRDQAKAKYEEKREEKSGGKRSAGLSRGKRY